MSAEALLTRKCADILANATGPLQKFVGEVVGTKMQKTAKVRVPRIVHHPVVNKPILRHRNFLIHDEDSQLVEGDIVAITYSNRISRHKTFTLMQIVSPADRYMDEETGKVYTRRTNAYDEKRIAWVNTNKRNGFDVDLERYKMLIDEAKGIQ